MGFASIELDSEPPAMAAVDSFKKSLRVFSAVFVIGGIQRQELMDWMSSRCATEEIDILLRSAISTSCRYSDSVKKVTVRRVLASSGGFGGLPSAL